MKKIVLAILTVCLMSFNFMGCKINKVPESNEGAEVSLTVDSEIEADISILVPSGNDNEKSMINCLIEDFALMFPNVKISLKFVSPTSYDSGIRQMAAAGTLPDIIWSNSPDFYYLVNKGLAMNLTPYIKASEKANIFNLKETFHSEFFDSGSIDGKLYCVPRSADTVVTFYNKEIFNAANVDMSTVKDGWSWESFLAACEKVRTYYNANGMSDRYVVDANFANWLSVNYPMLSSYGAEVIDANGNVVIDSDATKQALDMVRYMVNKRYVVDSSQSSGSSFETGGGAMLFQSSSFSHYAERKALKGKIDIVSFPLINDNNAPKIGSGIAGYAISNTTKYYDLCWQFLNLMLSKDGQEKMALNGLNLPSIRKDLADHTTANWGKKYPDNNLGAYLYGAEYKIDSSFLLRADISAKSNISAAINDLFVYAQDKSRDIDVAIAKCKQDIVDALADAKD